MRKYLNARMNIKNMLGKVSVTFSHIWRKVRGNPNPRLNIKKMSGKYASFWSSKQHGIVSKERIRKAKTNSWHEWTLTGKALGKESENFP